MANSRIAHILRRAAGSLHRLRQYSAVHDLHTIRTIRPRVLVLGIYLADRPNTAHHLARAYAGTTTFSVTQRWAAINGRPPSRLLADVTVLTVSGFVPKFVLLNQLLRESSWPNFDWIVFTDDDIDVPSGFLDAYLGYQSALGFALAQPARTRSSYADHKFVRQAVDCDARQTRFVEIGPVFSMDQRFAALGLPFDEASPMGWGYDYVWPVLAERHALPIGIIDATPVAHSLRRQAAAYDTSETERAMRGYLAQHPHLNRQEAFTVIRHHRCGLLAKCPPSE